MSTRNPQTKNKLLQETVTTNIHLEKDKFVEDIEQGDYKSQDDSENDEEILDSLYREVKYASKHLKNLEDNMKSKTYNSQKLRKEAEDSVENSLALLERLRKLNFEENRELNDKQKRAKISARATLDRLYGLMETIDNEHDKKKRLEEAMSKLFVIKPKPQAQSAKKRKSNQEEKNVNSRKKVKKQSPKQFLD